MHQVRLIEECRSNNKRAQIELYRKYNQAMYNIAMRLLKNSENADDIIQESFLSAFKNIHQFKAQVTFGAWLKKIVIHKCLNHLKKKELDVVRLDENSIFHLEKEDNDHWEFDNSIVLIDVKKSIDKLPDKYKFVLMLYLIEGYDHEEISEILNVSVVASRIQLMRGKNKLRQLLKQKGYGTES
ncbi:MAG: sigma-70 family RNA polymerase sigma factor [Flavobacteriaceae bacterium]|nr:sigma-70 family RNA polymerase sigma factor [Flavobacteriaceae bacterium]